MLRATARQEFENSRYETNSEEVGEKMSRCEFPECCIAHRMMDSEQSGLLRISIGCWKNPAQNDVVVNLHEGSVVLAGPL